MEIRQGIGASPGIAIAPAHLMEMDRLHSAKRFIEPEAVDDEVRRFHDAIDTALSELENLREQTSETIGEQYSAILDFHSVLLKDPSFRRDVVRRIKLNKFSAEYALSRVLRKHARSISSASSELFRQRVSDVFDIEQRLLRVLSSGRMLEEEVEGKVALVIRDLAPSQVASLDKSRIVAFVTDYGGKTSHAAIVARALGIPAVVGLRNITEDVSSGDTLIVDGSTGIVIVEPDEKTLERYQLMKRSFDQFEKRLELLKELPPETIDGFRIQLLANVEFEDEIDAALRAGAEGIGLYRTEFLFLGKERPPDEDEQYEVYRRAATVMGRRPVIMRTLDLGADKMPYNGLIREDNPFLGCRSIRYTLCRPELFKTQLRAILRASAYGNIKVMLPMVTTVEEVRRAKMLISDAMEELRERSLPFNPQIEIGIMIEVPSAALAADILSQEADFFSIGTNDLIQYTLAVDRGNLTVADLYQPAHPSVSRLLLRILETGKKFNIPVAVCGEMSGDVVYVPFLLGLGLETFSASPQHLLEVKKVIRSITLYEAETLAEEVLSVAVADEAERLLREKAHSIVPQLV